MEYPIKLSPSFYLDIVYLIKKIANLWDRCSIKKEENQETFFLSSSRYRILSSQGKMYLTTTHKGKSKRKCFRQHIKFLSTQLLQFVPGVLSLAFPTTSSHTPSCYGSPKNFQIFEEPSAINCLPLHFYLY